MKAANYLEPEDIPPEDLFKEPHVVAIEAPTGTGKTTALAELAVLIGKKESVDRIYFLISTHEACKNVVAKIVRRGGRVIHFSGLEKSCKRKEHLEKVKELIGEPSYACIFCPLYKKTKEYAERLFMELYFSNLPSITTTESIKRFEEVCLYPIVRNYVLDVTMDEEYKIKAGQRRIIIAPTHLFMTHVTINIFEKYARRQRKERKIVLIVDEADHMIYEGFTVRLEQLELTDRDRKILEQFSPKSIKLTKLQDVFNMTLKFVADIYSNFAYVDESTVKRYYELVNKIERLLASFNARAIRIAAYVLRNNIKTNIFKIVSMLDCFRRLTKPYYALQTVEMEKDRYIIHDYDFAFKVLFDTKFPFRSFWKFITTATFPTDEIVKSRYLSKHTIEQLRHVQRKVKSIKNVYVTFYPIFTSYEIAETAIGELMVERNKEIVFVADEIVNSIKTLAEVYRRFFTHTPNGIVLWFGNKRQYNFFVRYFKANYGSLILSIEDKKTAIKVDIPLLERRYSVFISYIGSPVSRSIDLDYYDISFAVSPLLRPPRRGYEWDVIDITKAISETLQACMRIVRSPFPSKPKLVVLERLLLKTGWFRVMPKWFKDLMAEAFIQLSLPRSLPGG